MTGDVTLDTLDVLHDREWMSRRIGKSKDWIYRHLDEIPHILIGATPNFTERLAREYLDAQTHRPKIGRTQRSQAAGHKR